MLRAYIKNHILEMILYSCGKTLNNKLLQVIFTLIIMLCFILGFIVQIHYYHKQNIPCALSLD